MSYFLIPMSHKLTVDLGDRSYPIYMGPGLLGRLGELCKGLGRAETCLLISDKNVDRLHGEAAAMSLEKAGFSVLRAAVPAGETSKGHDQLCALYEQAVEHRLDRSALIVALGGGVVGDLAGYMAATYLRGLRFVQAPTSLLAMVDSSVGGKTGINLPQGKNLVGAFHQPSLVLADTDTLKTLPKREYLSGLAEVVKYGIIRDAEFFQWLENQGVSLRDPAGGGVEELVARCCAIKAEVVGLDERESGLRAILNFGHTMGHAIEKVGGYGAWLHGEAVALGMAYAVRLSQTVRGFPADEAERAMTLMQELDLPVKRPAYDWPELRKAMAVDKKSSSSIPRFVLADRIGAVTVGCEVSEEKLEAVWNGMKS